MLHEAAIKGAPANVMRALHDMGLSYDYRLVGVSFVRLYFCDVKRGKDQVYALLISDVFEPNHKSNIDRLVQQSQRPVGLPSTLLLIMVVQILFDFCLPKG